MCCSLQVSLRLSAADYGSDSICFLLMYIDCVRSDCEGTIEHWHATSQKKLNTITEEGNQVSYLRSEIDWGTEIDLGTVKSEIDWGTVKPEIDWGTVK